MAFSENQVQLRKHGDAVLGPSDEPEALRSIALWREVNLRAADFGERELGDRYLRLRFEDLCAEPAARVAEVLALLRARGRRGADRRRGGAGAADARALARSRSRSCRRR